MTLRIENPCGVGIPAWPRLMRIPCGASYLGKTVGWLEAKLRSGEIAYILDDSAAERLVDRLKLDEWITKQVSRTGKLREPKAATVARLGAA